MVNVPAFSPAERLAGRPGSELAALAALVDTNPDDLESILNALAVTDPRARDAAGALTALPPAMHYRGPSASAVMLPFLCRGASRFSSGTYGVLYGADDIETAVAEVAYHHALRLRVSSATRGTTVVLARWTFRLRASKMQFVDLRQPDASIYDADDYRAAQSLGKKLRDGGALGVLYTSVRRKSGRCIGVFVPNAVETMRKRDDWRLVWDGRTISEVLRVA